MSAAGPDRRTVLVSRYVQTLLVVVSVVLLVRAGTLVVGGSGHWPAAALVVAYLAWLGSEVGVTFARPGRAATEVRTIVAYATARAGVVLAAVLWPVPATWTWSPWWVAAVVVFAAGVGLRRWAIRCLAAQYTHHVLTRDGHVVVSTGPYRLLRHPAYAGMLLANVGVVAAFASPAGFVALVALGAALVWRIRTEERAMWGVPGYPEFARGRARLLVGVW